MSSTKRFLEEQSYLIRDSVRSSVLLNLHDLDTAERLGLILGDSKEMKGKIADAIAQYVGERIEDAFSSDLFPKQKVEPGDLKLVYENREER